MPPCVHPALPPTPLLWPPLEASENPWTRAPPQREGHVHTTREGHVTAAWGLGGNQHNMGAMELKGAPWDQQTLDKPHRVLQIWNRLHETHFSPYYPRKLGISAWLLSLALPPPVQCECEAAEVTWLAGHPGSTNKMHHRSQCTWHHRHAWCQQEKVGWVWLGCSGAGLGTCLKPGHSHSVCASTAQTNSWGAGMLALTSKEQFSTKLTTSLWRATLQKNIILNSIKEHKSDIEQEEKPRLEFNWGWTNGKHTSEKEVHDSHDQRKQLEWQQRELMVSKVSTKVGRRRKCAHGWADKCISAPATGGPRSNSTPKAMSSPSPQSGS